MKTEPTTKSDELYSWLYEHGYSDGPVLRLFDFCRPHILQSNRLLDAGCGRGLLTEHMKSAEYEGEIVGVDVASYLIKMRVDGRTMMHCSLDDISLPDEYFDYVFCCDVLEHLDETVLIKAIMELKRVLMRGALWAFSISTVKSKVKGPSKQQLHVTIKPSDWWLELIDECGLTTTHTQEMKKGILVKGERSGA